MSDDRLRRPADIRAVLGAQARAHGRFIVVHARPRTDDGAARWAVVAGRKVGTAVRRNRAKRRLRALLREARLPRATDLVVVARPEVVDAPSAALVEELQALLARLAGAGVGR